MKFLHAVIPFYLLNYTYIQQIIEIANNSSPPR